MRSVVVVLPASMWAMMPMFLQRSNGTCLGTLFLNFLALLYPPATAGGTDVLISISPAIMRESLVGFGNAVNVFLLFDRSAATTAVTYDPANRQRSATIRIHFDRNLIVGAADTASLHFEQRLAVFDCFLEKLQRFVSALLLEILHRLIEDRLSGALLSLVHHRVHELGDQRRTVDRVGCCFA